MTVRILTGSYAGGYVIQSGVTTLSITASGYVGGTGLSTAGFGKYTVVNHGRVAAANYGIQLDNVDQVTNGSASDTSASITAGLIGVEMSAGGTVANFATITSTSTIKPNQAVYLEAGQVTNGSLTDTVALISGNVGVSVGAGAGTLTNFGSIVGVSIAVEFEGGGSVTNGAAGDLSASVSSAGGGVLIVGGPATITNFGAITTSGAGFTGAAVGAAGLVTNGSNSDTTALITGNTGAYAGAGGRVTNFGSIMGYGLAGTGDGVALVGATLINGGVHDRVAQISGGYGVWNRVTASTVANLGTITGSALDGVYLGAGGLVANDTASLIQGHAFGVDFNTAGAVINYGSILGGAYAGVCGVYYVDNGVGDRSTALIEGDGGVATAVTATVRNFAVIDGTSAAGVDLSRGGTIVNGDNACRGALIEGAQGVVVAGAPGIVTNSGTMSGVGYGANLQAGGSLTNGLANNNAALIEGYGGAELRGGGDVGRVTATNFGTILGLGEAGGFGVNLGPHGQLTNGASGHASALIEGHGGVTVISGGASTVTNFGTIAGTAGVAVQFGSPADTLVVEAQSTFVGSVMGDGGTLDLASGTGALTGLFTAGGVTVSGSMAATTFGAFDDLVVAAGAKFTDADAATTLAGTDSITSSGVLTFSGALANAGAIAANGGSLTLRAVDNTGELIANAGTLFLRGAVTGTGVAEVGAGTLRAASTADFDEDVAFAAGATGTLWLADGEAYSGSISGFSLTGATSLDIGDIAYSAATTTATYAGTSASGILTVMNGTHVAHIIFTGDYLASTWILSSDGHGGTDIVDPAKAAPGGGPAQRPAMGPPIHAFVQAVAAIGPPIHAFVQAVAAMGSAADAGAEHAPQSWSRIAVGLAGPRAQLA